MQGFLSAQRFSTNAVISSWAWASWARDRQGAGDTALTPAAAIALVGPCLSGHLPPAVPGHGVILVHLHAVPDPEALGDVHPCRAGHTVPAAVHPFSPAVPIGGRSHPPLPLLIREGPEVAEGTQVILQLFHAAHAAEHHLDPRQAAHPAHSPGRGRSVGVQGPQGAPTLPQELSQQPPFTGSIMTRGTPSSRARSWPRRPAWISRSM